MSLLLAVVGTMLAGVTVGVLGVAAIGSGHSGYGGPVGWALVGYGVAIVCAALAWWRGHRWARGPVVATAAVNLAVAWSFTSTAPLAWVAVAVTAITVVAAALPASSASRDEPAGPRR